MMILRISILNLFLCSYLFSAQQSDLESSLFQKKLENWAHEYKQLPKKSKNQPPVLFFLCFESLFLNNIISDLNKWNKKTFLSEAKKYIDSQQQALNYFQNNQQLYNIISGYRKLTNDYLENFQHIVSYLAQKPIDKFFIAHDELVKTAQEHQMLTRQCFEALQQQTSKKAFKKFKKKLKRIFKPIPQKELHEERTNRNRVTINDYRKRNGKHERSKSI